MKKSIKIISMFLLLLVFFTGCSKSKEDPNKAMEYIKQLKGFKATGKLTILNDVQKKEYSIEQIVKRHGGSYIKVDNSREVWFLEEKIVDNDIKRKKKLIQSRIYENFFEWTFLDKYIEKLYCDEKIKTKYEELEGKRYLLVELILCSNNRNLDKAVLYINTEDGNPSKICIYDRDKKQRVGITYEKFEGNANISDDFFDTKKLLNSD